MDVLAVLRLDLDDPSGIGIRLEHPNDEEIGGQDKHIGQSDEGCGDHGPAEAAVEPGQDKTGQEEDRSGGHDHLLRPLRLFGLHAAFEKVGIELGVIAGAG